MDFEPYFKVHSLISRSVHTKSPILGQMTHLDIIFHVVVSVYRFLIFETRPRSMLNFGTDNFFRKFDHVTPLLRELNWLPVKEQLFYRDSVLTFKCQNDLAPQYLTSKFTKRSNVHARNTRTRNSLQIPLYRTAIGQRTFSYRGANTWNNLHNELR